MIGLFKDGEAAISQTLTASALVGLLALAATLTVSVPQCRADESSRGFMRMEIQDLMDVEVTSVSKKPESLAEAAAAVFVITQEDIRRSGVTSIPEALRMVPGIEVARIDANKWAITSRGFNGRFASKMLVLMDGRTVYTPTFSGVFWDVQDTILEDIDRIEVIRGPGASLWGSNAVNSVINIITKEAHETLGGLVTAGGGTEERGFGSVRYGVRVGKETSLKVYGKYLDRDSQVFASSRDGSDAWHAVRGGFRMDSAVTSKDSLTLQGDIYDERLSETYYVSQMTGPFNAKGSNFGANILTRWNHSFSENSDFSLQLYYDRTDRDYWVVGEKRDTFDADFQHRFQLGGRQEIIWGLGYRLTCDKMRNSDILVLSPSSRSDNIFSAFLQDNITLVEDQLRLTLGSKFEHNDYTGFEVQPSIRIMWTPHDRHSFWAAVSRAVRTPSRGEEDNRLTAFTLAPNLSAGIPLPTQVVVQGSTDLQPEELLAYEVGYRVKALDNLSFDLSAFYNIYHKLSSPGAAQYSLNGFPPTSVTSLVVLGNNEDATTYGIELAADWVVLDWWRLYAAYTYLQLVSHSTLQNTSGGVFEGKDPHHQVSLRSQMNLSRNVEMDLWMRYVDRLNSLHVGRYLTMDARLAWRPCNNLEISLVGQNLFHTHHAEFTPEMIYTVPTQVERSVYGKITWIF